MRRRDVLMLGLAASGAALAQDGAPASVPPELAGPWPQARLVGRARLRVFGLHVYDARLWAPPAAAPDALALDWPAQPFALELQYARRFEGPRIAERSLQEMRRQAAIAPEQADRWLATMTSTFPDVRDGDRLTGLHQPGGDTSRARFFLNGQPRSEWTDAALVRQFFGIWLAPQTSEPALRAALLGGRA